MTPDRIGETWIAPPIRPRVAGAGDACLVHIYPTGPAMGRRYSLGTDAVVLGRGEGCDIRIDDHSVSRRHAQVQPTTDGFAVCDLRSTNGTFVNDAAAAGPRPLCDGDYLRVGNCIYRFLAGGNVEAEYHEEIYRLTIVDGLTQLHNHRYLFDFLERELARSVRHRRPLSVVMFDLDRFKEVNDTHGHLCGDFILREMSARLRPTVRREDLLARYGGEEFCLVLVETGPEKAARAGERVRQEVADRPFVFGSKSIALTVSVGVATTCGEAELAPLELVNLADQNLYEAKRTGRDRVVASP